MMGDESDVLEVAEVVAVPTELSDVPLERLRELQALLESRIAARLAEERQAAIRAVVMGIMEAHESGIITADTLLAAVQRDLRKAGLTITDTASAHVPAPAPAPTRKRRQSVFPPQYRHPAEPEKTWTGRGRQPRWFAMLAAGVGEDAARAQCAIPAN